MGLKSITKLIGTERLSNYVVTFGVEFLIMLISVALFKIVAFKFSDIGFAEFSINKRLVGFLMPLMMMGMGVSLPKFLPIETDKKQLEIHYSAILIVSSFFLLAFGIFFLISESLSKLSFGDYNHEKLFAATLVYIYSLMLHGCIYNYFRGKFIFLMSSALQFVNLGLLPLVAYFFAHNIFQYFVILSSSTILLLLLVNLFLIPIVRISAADYASTIKRIVKYGIGRMPGDVILGLFLAIPAFIGTNYFSITVGGNIAFCLSLFNIVIALMSPVNIILLPKASKIVHDKNFALLKDISAKLLFVSLGIGVVTLIIVYFLGENILILFNVKNHLETTQYLKIVFVGIVGFSVFSVIRSIIDAFYEKARVTSIIISAFVFFICSIGVVKSFGLFSITNILIAFTISINVLGLLTYYSLTRIYKTFQK